MVEISSFRVFMRTRLNIEPYIPLKPTKVGFIFIGPNSLSRAENLAAVSLKSGLRNYGSSRSFLFAGSIVFLYCMPNVLYPHTKLKFCIHIPSSSFVSKYQGKVLYPHTK